jgi:hypothetical protein
VECALIKWQERRLPPQEIFGYFFIWKSLKTDRDEPLTEKINLRITKSMKEELSKKEDAPEFCRQAIQKALSEEKQAKSQDS